MNAIVINRRLEADEYAIVINSNENTRIRITRSYTNKRV